MLVWTKQIVLSPVSVSNNWTGNNNNVCNEYRKCIEHQHRIIIQFHNTGQLVWKSYLPLYCEVTPSIRDV